MCGFSYAVDAVEQTGTGVGTANGAHEDGPDTHGGVFKSSLACCEKSYRYGAVWIMSTPESSE